MNDLNKFHMWGFWIIFGLFLLIIYKMLLPYFNVLVLASTFAIVFYPLKTFIGRWIKSEGFASFLTLLIILISSSGLFFLVGKVIVSELEDISFYGYQTGFADKLADIVPVQYQSYLADLSNDFSTIIVTLSRYIGSKLNIVVSNVAGFFLNFILFVIATYYFLKDGKLLVKKIIDILPIAKGQEEVIFGRIKLAVNGVVKGSLLVGIIQACIALAGFLIFGFPKAYVFALLTLFAAFVPFVGTALVFIPASLYLIIFDSYLMGVGLGLWGVFAVGLVDNFISPQLIGQKISLHPFVALLSVLAGFEMFGFLGFLLGPVVVSIFLELLKIYEKKTAS